MRLCHISSGLTGKLLWSNLHKLYQPLVDLAENHLYKLHRRLARAVHAEKLAFLTDIEGVYKDPADPSTLPQNQDISYHRYHRDKPLRLFQVQPGNGYKYVRVLFLFLLYNGSGLFHQQRDGGDRRRAEGGEKIRLEEGNRKI